MRVSLAEQEGERGKEVKKGREKGEKGKKWREKGREKGEKGEREGGGEILRMMGEGWEGGRGGRGEARRRQRQS